MNTQDQKQLHRWVQNWQKAQLALKTVRTQELQSVNHQQHMDLLDEMLTYACLQPRRQESTGLVEQQRIFSALRQTDSTQSKG